MKRMQECKGKEEIILGARKWPCGATCQTTSSKILVLGTSWPP
jgi:hypothetical protein